MSIRPSTSPARGRRPGTSGAAAKGGQYFKGEAPQADQLAAIARRTDVELVVLTATANDLGFKDHVVGCVTAWTTSVPWKAKHCAAAEQAEVDAGLPAATAGLRKAVDEIRAVLAAAGEAARRLPADDHGLRVADPARERSSAIPSRG